MKVLFVCSEYYAGMMPFGANIVNAMQDSDFDIYGIFVSSAACDYKKVIRNAETGKFHFINSPQGKVGRLIFRYFGFPIIQRIKNLSGIHTFDIIHFLTEDCAIASYIVRLAKRHKVYYTVHDLKAHEHARGRFLQSFVRDILVTKRVELLIKKIENLVTCSIWQQDELKKQFPHKRLYYHQFPSLITRSIIEGNAIPKELNGVKDYILFFGRIEPYKGVDILYNQYILDDRLRQYPLVIAGSGFIYFQRNLQKEQNIYFLNRYIEDDEIKYLFNSSSCVVCPYVSATQSGIISLTDFFVKPVIVSSIPYLKSQVQEGVSGYVFDSSDPSTLGNVIEKLSGLQVSVPVSNTVESTIAIQLIEIYNDNMNSK